MSPSSKKLEVIADPDKPTIVTRRTFDAPRALVFDAWTKPELMKRWLGPRALEMVLCEVDLRVGGGYRYVHRAPDGQEYGFHGTYREIARPDRLVSTFVFELFPDAEAVDTLELEERDGKTTVTTTTVHTSMQARDGHLAAGMERGMEEGYARLDELLPQMKARGVTAARGQNQVKVAVAAAADTTRSDDPAGVVASGSVCWAPTCWQDVRSQLGHRDADAAGSSDVSAQLPGAVGAGREARDARHDAARVEHRQRPERRRDRRTPPARSCSPATTARRRRRG